MRISITAITAITALALGLGALTACTTDPEPSTTPTNRGDHTNGVAHTQPDADHSIANTHHRLGHTNTNAGCRSGCSSGRRAQAL